MRKKRLRAHGIAVAWAVVLSLVAVAALCAVAPKDHVTMVLVGKSVIETRPGVYEGGWIPNRITVKEGQRVTLTIRAQDVVHNFALPAFGVTVPSMIPGETRTVTFVANKKGKFIFLCEAECGIHHQRMIGELVVASRTNR